MIPDSIPLSTTKPSVRPEEINMSPRSTVYESKTLTLTDSGNGTISNILKQAPPTLMSQINDAELHFSDTHYSS
eukprot:UN14044